MVLYRAAEDRHEVIDFGGRSPAALNPADYPLAADGVVSDLFPWRRVEGDRNLHGPMSIAIPGVVAGVGEAHARYGSKPWRNLVLPAVAMAREGLLVDWFTTANIASAAADLRRYPAAAAEFLRDGLPPSPPWGVRTEIRLPRPNYAATLEAIAEHGPRAFYEGALAQRIANEIGEAGGSMRPADLAAYRARVFEPLAIPWRDAIVHASPELTAGPTLAQALRHLEDWQPGSEARPDAGAYAAYARALQHAYRQRLGDMGDVDGKRALGAEHLAPSCTTHFSVVDARGNMAAVTQTLLGVFGSKFVTPQTGILMNNGIMWFDPAPGHANSLDAARRCLANYTPVIAALGDGRRLAVGASGGRRILPAITQLLSFAIDYRMDLQDAFECPRIDASEGAIVIGDARMPADTQRTLADTFDFESVSPATMPMKFACPSATMRDPHPNGKRVDGKPVNDKPVNQGATDFIQPWADAVAAAR